MLNSRNHFWDPAMIRPESPIAGNVAEARWVMDVSFSPRARATILWFGGIAGFFILLTAAHALHPFAWAIITAFVLHPVVSLLNRKTRVPKQIVAIWLFLMLGLVVALIIITVAPSAIDQAKGLQDDIPRSVDRIDLWLVQHQSARMRQLGINPNFLDNRINEISNSLTDRYSERLLPLLFGTFSFAVEVFVYLVASFYFLVYGDRFVRSARSLLNPKYHREIDQLLTDINVTLSRYIRGQILLVAIMATATFIALSVLEVKYALVIAIASGFLELIPLIGPWLAGGIAISMSLFQDGTPFGWTHLTLAIVIAAVYFALRQLEDAFVIPNVIGRLVKLHPLLVIFVIVTGTALGGMLGLILAVPIAAVIKILVTYFYAKIMAADRRHVRQIRAVNDLRETIALFPDMPNETVVLILEPGAITWEDVELARSVSVVADEHSVQLSVVTPDPIAGTIFTAIGIKTEAIAASLQPSSLSSLN